MHEGRHVWWSWRQGAVVGFLFAERQTAENFTDPLRAVFDLLMVSSVYRVQNWSYLPCTNSVDNRFSKSMTDVYRTVYN